MVTMKSGCFAESGSEEVSPPISLFLKYFACLQYVVSGSDDFRIYWWKLPKCVSGMYNLDGLMQYFYFISLSPSRAKRGNYTTSGHAWPSFNSKSD